MGRMSEIESAGGVPRGRQSLLAAARYVSVLLDLLDVQHLWFSVRQYARLRRHDLRRRHGTLSQIKGRFLGRQLLLGSLALMAHGRVRRNHWQGGISLSHVNAAGVFPTPVLRRRRMR